MNKKGQAFAIYKLLIGAIIALLILIIIIGAINYLEGLKFDISRQRFVTGLKQAVKQPNKDVLKIENVIFKKGDFYSTVSLGREMMLNEEWGKECIELDAADTTAFDLESDKITIREEIITTVYIQCRTTDCAYDCEICCIVSFGKPIEVEES